jgi:hypothetical protein
MATTVEPLALVAERIKAAEDKDITFYARPDTVS